MSGQYSLFDDDQPRRQPEARNDVLTGDAGEALTLYKLRKNGWNAHDVSRDLPYDIVVDVGDGLICRVQVKTSRKAVRGCWNYRVTRGNWRSATGTYAYSNGDYDVAAFVALSLEKVVFVPGVHATMRLTNTDFNRPDSELQSW